MKAKRFLMTAAALSVLSLQTALGQRNPIVEGPFMLKRQGKYYFMWSEGGWGGPDYCVAYAVSDSPLGPFRRIGKILEQDAQVATGAGHHSVIKDRKTDDYYIVYHRRPLGDTGRDHRVTCIDRLEFDADGLIKPVKMTR